MNVQATLTKKNNDISLKGGMYTLTSILLQDNQLEDIVFQLDEKIKQAPKFFEYAPVILDVQALQEKKRMIDLPALCHLLRSKKLIPIGVRGADAALKEAAKGIGLAVFPEDKSTHKKIALHSVGEKHAKTPEGISMITHSDPLVRQTRVISQPVRSGQQIYAPNGDLIVLSSVSAGAEVLADGHIHIYGPLRGRALAGVMGNKDAMIFCKSLEAELVSVASRYRVNEDLRALYWKQNVCIQLEEDHLNIRLV